jgi:hypothetical protein
VEHCICPLLLAGGCGRISTVELRQLIVKFVQLIGQRFRFSVSLGKELGLPKKMRPAPLKFDVGRFG